MSAWLNSEGIGPALRMDDGGEWRGRLPRWLQTPDARWRLPFVERGWLKFLPPENEADFDAGAELVMAAVYGESWRWWFPCGVWQWH